MAAYAALVSLEHVLLQILRHDQDFTLLHHHDKIESLHKNVICLVAFLDNLPEDASTFIEDRIRNAANRAEDIIERILYELRMGVVHHPRQVILSVFGGTAFKELQGVMKELEGIVEEVRQIKTSSETKDPVLSHFHASAYGSSSSRIAPSAKGAAIGLEKDLYEIKLRLRGESSNLQIIPITGMGGIGKTTLAQYAYNDPLSIDYFDVRAWAAISEEYVTRKVLLGMLRSVDASSQELFKAMLEDKLLEHLYKCLKGRRYLIVLDDVWDVRVWDAFGKVFPDDLNGSRIIITSRNLDVASYVDPSSHPHQMKLMDEDQSWKLLREKVFAQEHCPLPLERIGEFISEQCRGLPLAIIVIAGIIKANPMQETWEHIAQNVSEAVNTSEEKFTKIMSLSYKHLPHHLRPCFLYMGSFPEDYDINVSKLVKLWVAEGFLKPSRSKTLEEVAEEYLEDLTKRNLVTVFKKRLDGKIKVVKIHDLLRDLCLKKAQDEKFLQVIDESSPSLPDDRMLNSRRLIASEIVLCGFPDSPIRTILLPDFFPPNSNRLHALSNFPNNTGRCFKLLRILDASARDINWIPVEIGELLQLRYLALTLRYNGQVEVPNSLSKLQNLQTLIIMLSYDIFQGDEILFLLPSGIWRLPHLRHLIVFEVCLPDPCVGALTTFESLCTLSHVINFTCSEMILKLVPNISKLKIFYPSNDIFQGGWSKHRLYNLINFHLLEKLNLQVGGKSPDYCFRKLQKSDIAFPETLKRLTLRGCRLLWQDMTIIGSLPNLEVLKLRDNACYGGNWETTEGEFFRLKVLLIDEADPQHWITESSHFPSLQRLLLYSCTELHEIPSCIGDISTLELMKLMHCHSSMNKSAKRIKDEQQELGNDSLQVHILIDTWSMHQ